MGGCIMRLLNGLLVAEVGHGQHPLRIRETLRSLDGKKAVDRLKLVPQRRCRIGVLLLSTWRRLYLEDDRNHDLTSAPCGAEAGLGELRSSLRMYRSRLANSNYCGRAGRREAALDTADKRRGCRCCTRRSCRRRPFVRCEVADQVGSEARYGQAC